MERRGFLGSSDAPVIMKVSPWRTPYQLWEEKTGRAVFSGTNYAIEKGIRMEPQARAHYELMNFCEMPPLKVSHRDYPFLQANLDGANVDLKRALEIKYVGKQDHELARSGRVPSKYWPQVQHQLLVTGFERLDYFSFNGNEGIVVEVLPDLPYLETLLKEELSFWQLVVDDVPPVLSEKDFKKITCKETLSLLMEWKVIYEIADRNKKKAETIRREIEKRLVDHPRLRGNGVLIHRITRKGQVDYSRIPELQNIDLETYRKPETQSFRFTVDQLGEDKERPL
jgi:putative phage-type endonuclease